MNCIRLWCALDSGCGEGDEEQKKRDRESIVQTRFHVERLADAQRHAGTVHNDLAQAGVGRREDGGQDPCFPNGQLREHEPRRHCAQEDGEQHSHAQQARRQAPETPQDSQVGAAGIGEEQQHQPDFGQVEEDLGTEAASEDAWPTGKQRHPREREQNGRGENRPLHPPGDEAVEEQERDEDGEKHGVGRFRREGGSTSVRA
jgi:hypothetical protein